MPRRAAMVSILSILASAACLATLLQGRSNLQGVQYRAEEQISAGNLLVASEKLGDPNFAESVVLILQHDQDKGSLGVIINRRSEIPLSRIFPEIKAANADPVYVGGPVSLTVMQALLRLGGQTEDVQHVLGDIYVTGSKELIERSVRAHITPSKFRLYVGYAGWEPGQLEAEAQVGAWTVLANRSKAIFDEDPDSLWSRLTHESHMQVAHFRSQRLNDTAMAAILSK